VKIAPIYRDGKEGTLISLNLPFSLIIMINSQTTPMSCRIKLSANSKDMWVLDLDYFYRFVSAINEGKRVTCVDAKREKELFFMEGKDSMKIDEEWKVIIAQLAKIDKIFHVDFMCPESITFDEKSTISDLVEIIDKGYTVSRFNESNIVVTSEPPKKEIEAYKQKGYFEGLKISSENCRVNLLDKVIELGKSRAIFPFVKFKQTFAEIREEIKKTGKAKITLVPYKDDRVKMEYKLKK